MKLEDFLDRLDTLLNRGSAFKPHKYLILLSVIELVENNKITENKIYYDEQLKSVFSSYFNVFKHEGDRNRPYTPFFHLKTSGFWFLKAKPGKEDYLESLTTIGGPAELFENIEYAYFSEPVYKLLTNKDTAKKIKNKILSILIHNLKHEDQSEQIVKTLYINDGKEMYQTNGLSQSLFQHEDYAINLIKMQTRNMGRVINNVYIFDDQSGNYYELDAILVAHTGIYVIELKHWSGHINIAPYSWIVNSTQYRTSPHKNNVFKCRILKGIYQHKFRTYPDIWVESVVVLTNPEAVVEGANSPGIAAEQNVHNPTFASIQDFIAYLRKKEASVNQHLLDDRQIDAIISYLDSLNNPRPGVKYTVPGYETVEYIFQTPECIELVARPLSGRAKGLNRFRVFRPPYNVTREERERFIKRAYNTLNTVSQLGDHPHIHKVWLIENENGDIIEGSDWSETGTLRDFILKEGKTLSFETARNICRGIAQALHKAHQLAVIHRAVKPENVLMMNNIPKLMNFDLAYQLEDNRVTVLTDINKINDDGYIAPEILLLQDIDEGTDFFSLGVIAYELFTGEKPFSSTREFMARGGRLSRQALQKLMDKGVPGRVINAVQDMVLADRVTRLKDGDAVLKVFSEDMGEGAINNAPMELNPILLPGDLHDVYEVLELIGEGAAAQIYKAKTIRGKTVVLKIFNREIALEKIIRESEITSAVRSPYVVHCDNKIGHWKNDRYFLVLDYIKGETLRKIIDRKEKPDLETFRSVALCLMEAVDAFHNHKDDEGNAKPFLHSDIKPENIILTKGIRPVLIDCGIAGEPRIDVYQGSAGYVPPDSIIGSDMKYSPDGDLFALGVTLWEWLLGEKPYKNLSVNDVPSFPADTGSDVPENLRKWLLKAVATTSSDRFDSINEMRQAFIALFNKGNDKFTTEEFTAGGEDGKEQNAMIPGNKLVEELKEPLVVQPVQDHYNSFVSYLNSLSNASAGNENATAESQITNVEFERIFVKNPLADYIYDRLINQKVNVILTGNAGDGKTTIAFDIFCRTTGIKRAMGPIERAGQNLVIIKDMSELEEDERVKFLAEAFHAQDKNYLIVSNTGTLLESYKKLKLPGFKANESDLLEMLEADDPDTAIPHGRVWVINIGRIDSIQIACKIFERMLEQQNWNRCVKCQHGNDCPLLFNVNLLNENLAVVCRRVMLLYRRLYEYNMRLTLRQMTGHLAYAITAGLNCRDIGAMSQVARQNRFWEFVFFNRFFGDDGELAIPEAMQLLPVRQIRKVNFGTVLDPAFEKKIWFKEGRELAVTSCVQKVLQSLMTGFESSHPRLRRQVRRLVYFFFPLDDAGGKQFISVFLQSPTLLQYTEFDQTGQSIPLLQERKYLTRIMQVLQEYFTGVRLPEGSWQATDYLYITLNRRTAGAWTQIVLADFRTDEFELTFKPRYRFMEAGSGTLCLRHQGSGIELELDLPFMDYVERRYQGEVAEELSAYYVDRLERFKVKLLNYYHSKGRDNNQFLRLLRIGSDRKFVIMQVLISNGCLEVLL